MNLTFFLPLFITGIFCATTTSGPSLLSLAREGKYREAFEYIDQLDTLTSEEVNTHAMGLVNAIIHVLIIPYSPDSTRTTLDNLKTFFEQARKTFLEDTKNLLTNWVAFLKSQPQIGPEQLLMISKLLIYLCSNLQGSLAKEVNDLFNPKLLNFPLDDRLNAIIGRLRQVSIYDYFLFFTTLNQNSLQAAKNLVKSSSGGGTVLQRAIFAIHLYEVSSVQGYKLILAKDMNKVSSLCSAIFDGYENEDYVKLAAKCKDLVKMDFNAAKHDNPSLDPEQQRQQAILTFTDELLKKSLVWATLIPGINQDYSLTNYYSKMLSHMQRQNEIFAKIKSSMRESEGYEIYQEMSACDEEISSDIRWLSELIKSLGEAFEHEANVASTIFVNCGLNPQGILQSFNFSFREILQVINDWLPNLGTSGKRFAVKNELSPFHYLHEQNYVSARKHLEYLMKHQLSDESYKGLADVIAGEWKPPIPYDKALAGKPLLDDVMKKVEVRKWLDQVSNYLKPFESRGHLTYDQAIDVHDALSRIQQTLRTSDISAQASKLAPFFDLYATDLPKRYQEILNGLNEEAYTSFHQCKISIEEEMKSAIGKLAGNIDPTKRHSLKELIHVAVDIRNLVAFLGPVKVPETLYGLRNVQPYFDKVLDYFIAHKGKKDDLKALVSKVEANYKEALKKDPKLKEEAYKFDSNTYELITELRNLIWQTVRADVDQKLQVFDDAKSMIAIAKKLRVADEAFLQRFDSKLYKSVKENNMREALKHLTSLDNELLSRTDCLQLASFISQSFNIGHMKAESEERSGRFYLRKAMKETSEKTRGEFEKMAAQLVKSLNQARAIDFETSLAIHTALSKLSDEFQYEGSKVISQVKFAINVQGYEGSVATEFTQAKEALKDANLSELLSIHETISRSQNPQVIDLLIEDTEKLSATPDRAARSSPPKAIADQVRTAFQVTRISGLTSEPRNLKELKELEAVVNQIVGFGIRFSVNFSENIRNLRIGCESKRNPANQPDVNVRLDAQSAKAIKELMDQLLHASFDWVMTRMNVFNIPELDHFRTADAEFANVHKELRAKDQLLDGHDTTNSYHNLLLRLKRVAVEKSLREVQGPEIVRIMSTLDERWREYISAIGKPKNEQQAKLKTATGLKLLQLQYRNIPGEKSALEYLYSQLAEKKNKENRFQTEILEKAKTSIQEPQITLPRVPPPEDSVDIYMFRKLTRKQGESDIFDLNSIKEEIGSDFTMKEHLVVMLNAWLFRNTDKNRGAKFAEMREYLEKYGDGIKADHMIAGIFGLMAQR